MVDGQGGLRPHWRGILGALSAFGNGGLAERQIRLDRAFEEEGVTAVLPGAGANSWRCCPVPLPLPASEFASISQGLIQRARLLEAFLEDLYGPQTLLSQGLLPPALAFANPGFLRVGRLARGPLLRFYAADLVRAPDGNWQVLSDRTAGAGGIGYARENRRLLARVLPESFRPVPVRALGPFFDQWQDSLRQLAPAGVDNPTVALLTPGTHHRQWFEHMYLSRELSCALVEGGDLTVRAGELFLKTLKGPQRVDVLLRRVDGRMMDPLELESGSLLGVPGLMDAARGGNVHITNDPGTGAAEAPGLAAFLPALCQHLLYEPLQMQSVPTLWLGNAEARAWVAASPQDWRLRPALDAHTPSVDPASLPPHGQLELRDRVAARPWDWVAIRSPNPSVAPCLTAEGLQPRPVVLRVFLMFDGTSWQAMPGGLARVVDQDDPDGRRHGVSKDVWVISDDNQDIVGPPVRAFIPVAVRRGSGDLPSRVADNLFWLGRYIERLDRAARLGRGALARLSRAAAMLPRERTELDILGRCLTAAGILPEESASSAVASLMGAALVSALREPGHVGPESTATGGAIHTLFETIGGLTDSVRDRLTGEMYATFTQTLRAARADADAAARPTHGQMTDLDGLSHAMVSAQRFCTAVAGVAAENMVRGGGWLFLELGRRIERARAVAEELALVLRQAPARQETALRVALELCDSAITYRNRYLNVLQPGPVLDLVLADQGNPRGLAFQLVAMHALLDDLGDKAGAREMMAGTAAGLLAEVEALVGNVFAAPDQEVAAAALPPRLEEVAQALADLSDRITRRYFALLPAVRTVGMTADVTQLRGAA